ncbi:hypothetical protein [Adonisia turfae]|uniref:Alpha/beta hydrolase n=1 Tax=Adonisia turfae CCMR0081 TaxID=2292702 RepID=A0A6M0RCU3_9CYAN|nr:hypothetical protein [Adonisia turfae]NEZ54174.1 hypothetical protein [Adonisia turfae CCMR0081]
MLENPSKSGSFQFKSVVYAAPGLNYGNNPSWRDYQIFDNPTQDFLTRRIDLSGIAEIGQPFSWPFQEISVPINGIMRMPLGQGPFPLAIIAHGNHKPEENSTPGYIYLCELLASYGIIAATIDVNFLNGGNRGENDGRAIIHLEHIRQFQMWNNQIGHPLENKVDMSNIMIIGHSRGGEAVGHASYFNKLLEIQFDEDTVPIRLDGSEGIGPYNFEIKGVVAIAPTDSQYEPLSGATKVQENYLVLHGSRDADVFSFDGYKTYDRAHPIDLDNPTNDAKGFKSLLWIYKANHNFFNSVWEQESEDTLAREEQENIAKIYISAMAQLVLLKKVEYLALLEDYRIAVEQGWFSDLIKMTSQFQSQKRLFIQHFEEKLDEISISKPFQGNIQNSQINAVKLSLDKTDIVTSDIFLGQETQGLRIDWSQRSGTYTANILPSSLDSLDISNYQFLAFRVAQSSEENNPKDIEQDFLISVSDTANTTSFLASSINRILYPDIFVYPGSDIAIKRTIMQTLRVPFRTLEKDGIKVNEITRIQLSFVSTPSGTLYFDEFQFTL